MVFEDPALLHRKLNELQGRLDAVENKVLEMLPEVEAIFAKFSREEALDGDRQAIHDQPCLHDYYVLLQMRIVGVATACTAISSGMVSEQNSCRALVSCRFFLPCAFLCL